MSALRGLLATEATSHDTSKPICRFCSWHLGPAYRAVLDVMSSGEPQGEGLCFAYPPPVDFGNVGMLFMPGELPPELVAGLPDDFETAAPDKYYREPHLHAVGGDYQIPGHLLSLVDAIPTIGPIVAVVGLRAARCRCGFGFRRG